MHRLVVATVIACVLGSCDDGTVDLSFRPTEGDVLAYDTDVESSTTTELDCEPPTTRHDEATLTATHRVLEVGDDGVRVEVELAREGVGARTVVVRFDRAAQLTAIEEVEGIPAAALGELGLSEVFPAAAGAPPDRELAPGDRWDIDDAVSLDEESAATRLRGSGRLVELGVEDGRDTATVETTTALPIATSSSSASGTRTLTGEQHTEVRATYDIDDGAVLRADAVTTGRFDLELGPPSGGAPAEPCLGTLEVEVRSRVTRRG